MSLRPYLFYSVLLHAVVFFSFQLFPPRVLMEPPPPTQITMIRLTPRLGTPKGSLKIPPAPPVQEFKSKAKAEPVSTPLKQVTKPQVKKPEPKPPIKKAPKPKVKTKAKPRIKKPRIVRKKPPPKKPQIRTRKVDQPSEQEIQEALAGINQQIEQRQVPRPQIPGRQNTGTATNSLGDPAGEIEARQLQYVQYQSRVRAKIIRHWVRTHMGGETRKLRARVLVRINASGTVTSRQVVKRSGDASFDNSCLRAVDRASPLPIPPTLVQNEALREGFIVDFASRVLGR